MNEVIVVGSKQELIGCGYVYENIGKEFMYEGLSFLLKENGIRSYGGLHYWMAQPRPEIIPRNPKWVLKVKDICVTVTDLE
tara:strand:+ start:178 stop:420 length:243 start_codon:yes stop_codon:yes gene_type:complete